MKRPTLYCAVTGHGFGHAVRMASIAQQIQSICPDVLLILATRSPRWLLESYIDGDFIYRPQVLDVGVVQSDSLRMDLAGTLAQMTALYRGKDSLVRGEVNYLRNNRVDLVLADIPALATAIAHQAGVPCWLVGNFGWNFIYREWGEAFDDIVSQLEADYAQGDRLFRLPWAEPMTVFPHQQEVGLTGGEPRYAEATLRAELNWLAPSHRTALLTFGGLGLAAIPYSTLRFFPEWHFITFDAQAPSYPNLTVVQGKQYRPVDLMPFCNRVISKPGFSTFAEALRLEVPLVSLTRENFAEAPLLLEGLQDYGHHQIVTTEDFFTGQWDFLHQSPLPPRQSQKLDPQGATAIAEAVVNQLNSTSGS
jgi:hypothetical protein